MAAQHDDDGERCVHDKSNNSNSNKSSDDVGLSASVRHVHFAPLRGRTAEAIAYAACPVCSTTLHMLDMLLHLTSTHRDLDVAHCQRICDERLRLYQRVVGEPLQKLGAVRSSSGSSSGSNVSRTPAAVATTAATSAASLSTASSSVGTGRARVQDEVLQQLPTVTEQGYMCNWCVVRGNAHATRDALLLHVATVHPHVDVDAIEPLIPALPANTAAMRAATGSAARGAAATASSTRHAAAATPTHTTVVAAHTPQPSRRLRLDDDAAAAAAVVANKSSQAMTGVDGGANAKATAATGVSLSMQLVRRRQVTVPRHLTNMRLASDEDTVNGTEQQQQQQQQHAASSMATTMLRLCAMREGRFTCELCHRVYVSEEQLLNHLIDKHTNNSSSSSSNGSMARTTTTATAAAALTGGSSSGEGGGGDARARQGGDGNCRPGITHLTCDLCSSSRVYTQPSALYAHVRIKHPLEDATLQVERILAAQRTRTIFLCRFCNRAFASQVALDGHLLHKHGVCATAAETSAHTRGGADGAAATVAAASGKQASKSAEADKLVWWCNECERGFTSARALHSHKVQKHQMPLQLYPCPACKRTFHDVYALQEHIRATHRSINVDDLGLVTHARCPECSRFFLTHEDLRKHAVRQHQRDPRLPARALERPPRAAAAAAPRAATTATAADSAATTTTTATSDEATTAAAAAGEADEAASVKKPRKVARVRRAAAS